MTNASVKVS